jgi:hypothetical protein
MAMRSVGFVPGGRLGLRHCIGDGTSLAMALAGDTTTCTGMMERERWGTTTNCLGKWWLLRVRDAARDEQCTRLSSS